MSKHTDTEMEQAIETGFQVAQEHLAGGSDGATAVEPADVTPVTKAMTLPEPEWVIRCCAAPPDNAVVCSIGEPMILAAPGGSGKSYVALHLAIAGTTGEVPASACGLQVRPGPVIMLSYEDSLARIGFRAARLSERDDVQQVTDQLWLVTDPQPLWRADDAQGAVPTAAYATLRARIEADAPSLLIIDPISVAAAGLNLNDGAAARACMRSLAALSQETSVGVLVIAHDTKAARNEARTGGSPGAGAVAGSGQWFDAARGVLYLSRAHGLRYLECVKANHGPSGWGRQLDEMLDGFVFRGFREVGRVIRDMDAERKQATNHRNDDTDDPSTTVA